ncbi:MAG: DUF1772 domain-containing protein [Anaerolineales bacterium]|nr:DUF1772 domain-containing protein [Anaerolineales bacterium]
MKTLFDLTLPLVIIGCGLMAGIFFTFSNFAIPALNQAKPANAVSVMQAINLTIVNPLFLLIFLGTPLASGILIISALANWQTPQSGWVVAGSLIYLLGCLGVTVAFNIPLNNQLAQVSVQPAEAEAAWRNYAVGWTRWNHIRTISAVLALVLFTLALRA